MKFPSFDHRGDRVIISGPRRSAEFSVEQARVVQDVLSITMYWEGLLDDAVMRALGVEPRSGKPI